MPRTSGPEAQLYPRVEQWAKDKLKCWETKIDTGPSIGRVDVVGVRDFGGGDLASRSEVIAIEVKRGGAPFAKSAGQAHGYSVMADRCYLALEGTSISDEQMVVASRLQVGILLVTPKSVSEVLTAPLQEPLPELRARLLEKLGCGTCSLCSLDFPLGDTSSPVSSSRRLNRVVRREHEGSRGIGYATENNLGLMWWLHEAARQRDGSGRGSTYWRRFLCPDCAFALHSEA